MLIGWSIWLINRVGQKLADEYSCNFWEGWSAFYATLLLFTRCQHYNTDDFSDESDFNIVHQFNTAN